MAFLTTCSDDASWTATSEPGTSARSADLGPYAEVARRLESSAEFRSPEAYTLASTRPLRFPSGRVVAADGIMLLQGAPPFARPVPAGSFPVDLLLGRYTLPDGRPFDEVLAAGIRYSRTAVVSWSGASAEGEPRTAAEVPCYPVDSGTGGLFDAAAFEALGDYHYGGGREGRELVAAVGGHGDPLTVLEGPSGEGAVFRSGGGDGCYQTFFGLDAEGRVALLVTDFTARLGLPIGAKAGSGRPSDAGVPR